MRRVNQLYAKLQLDNKEQTEKYNELVDDLGTLKQKNTEYRDLNMKFRELINSMQKELSDVKQ